MKVLIHEIRNGRRGPPIAQVTQRGKVTPDDEATEHIVEHVARIKRERLKGRAFLERVERSFTNGYVAARIVR